MASLCFAGTASAGLRDKLNEHGIALTGANSFQYWRNDAAERGRVDNYQNYLDLTFVTGPVTYGGQFNVANFYAANPEVPTEPIAGIRQLFIEWRAPNFQLFGGDFFANFGKGMALSVTKDEAFLIDRTIFGGMGNVRLGDVKLTALSGVSTQELTGEKDGVFATEAILPKMLGVELAFRYSYAWDYNDVIRDGKRHTGTIGLRSKLGELDFTAELGKLWRESGKDGYGVYVGAEAYKGSWSMLVEYKDYFRFNNGFNNPPIADLVDEEAILDDIYGFYMRHNYSWLDKNIDFYGSFGYYTWFEAPKDSFQYFVGVIKPDLFDRAYVQLEYGLRTDLETTHRALASADVTVVPGWSVQFLISGKEELSDLGDLSEWHMVAGFAKASLLAFSYVYDFGNRQAIDRTTFHSAQVDVDWTDSLRTSVFIGSSRGGLLCSGGLCRWEPPFDGGKLQVIYKF